MALFILTGRTESGDDIGPYVWERKPAQEDINCVFLRDIPEEVEAGTCDNYQVSKTYLEN